MALPRNDTGYLVGLIGSGIGTSLSPALHEREADALGVRYLYRILDLDELGVPATAIGDVLAAARLAGYHGLNITHPVKQLVLDHLDELAPDAAAVGAVNTIVLTDGRSVGYNTDLTGFARSVGHGLPDAALDSIVLLGAGGAGAAVAHALLTLGAGTVRIFDLDRRRSDKLAASLTGRFGAGRATADELDGGAAMADALREADGLAHATPIGMEGHPGVPVPVELLRPDLWVADVVYRPLDTELLTAARERGCRVLNGGPMVVFQAADAFRIITGREPDTDRMLRHFDALVPDTHAGRQPDAHR
ncbi:MAG: shikimate dehydrogenase [Actinophytocola sp.]|uniref:shikimate dehydrogenase n=1 Tax=Actinophytocola sp. TaxID=1872138 RepID=UPI001322095C|nr:shikimate dehydrogenase [Actinophytocola sp.]MPZ82561.1 shikimate dehydrogenase [Actinophytocola sp.]